MKTKKSEENDDPGGKSKEKIIRIFNLSEDVWPFIRDISDKKAKRYEIEENANLADRDLFSLAKESRFTFICPKPIDEHFLAYFRKLFYVRDIEVLNPQTQSGLICRDILEDKKLMDRIVRMAKETKKLMMVSYSTTPYFLKLIKELRDRGVKITTPNSPEEQGAWTVNFYGSKSGVRQLAQKSGAIEPDFKMPDGLVCSGIFDTAKIAANKYCKENGVVLKTNKGHAGMGVLIFRKGDLPTRFEECEQEIRLILKKDKYWKKYPVVVESLVKPNPKIGGGFPNAEFVIQKNGEIELLYYCGMRVDENGVFKGVEINDKVLPKRVAARIIDTGYFIGEQYAKEGYRGYFDIDFIAGKDKEIYVNESNVRMTGGTHVYWTAEQLFGKDFMSKTYVLSHNTYELEKYDYYTFESLLHRLKPILFSRRKKEGVVIASASMLDQNKLAYIIFGKNRRRALAIEREMERLLA